MLTYGCVSMNLKKLSVRQNTFKTKGCQYIQIYPMRGLIELNLSRNQIMDEGVAKLAEASYLRNLTKLFLDDNQLTATAAVSLGLSQFLTQITHLSLSYNVIGKTGLTAIANSGNFANIAFGLHDVQHVSKKFGSGRKFNIELSSLFSVVDLDKSVI